MTFPAVVDQQATSNNATFTMPSFSAGNLLLVNAGSMTAPSGVSSGSGETWTLVGSLNIGSTTFERTYAKVAVTGDTFFISGGFSTGGFVTSISGWSGDVTGIGYAGSTGAINPPSLTMPLAKDYLWIAGGSTYANSITAAPTNYTNLLGATFNTNADHKFAIARRTLNAASEDPGAFTGTASFAGGWTIAVPPTGAAPGLPSRRRRQALLVR